MRSAASAVINQGIARRRQSIRHPFGVIDVHLTSVRLDENLLQIPVRSTHETRCTITPGARFCPAGQGSRSLSPFCGRENSRGPLRKRVSPGFLVRIKGYGIQFEAMIDETKAELLAIALCNCSMSSLRNSMNLSRPEIDQMVVVLIRNRPHSGYGRRQSHAALSPRHLRTA